MQKFKNLLRRLIYNKYKTIKNKIWWLFHKDQFPRCGINVRIQNPKILSYENIFIGNDVFINDGAMFLASESKIIIGNKVIMGPNVSIIGGDHNYSEIGRFMYDVKNKKDSDDKDVIIENDVWIGSNAIILKGVTIGSGAIIGAGSVVVKNVPKYSIVAGNPAIILKMRFSKEEIHNHEKILYKL